MSTCYWSCWESIFPVWEIAKTSSSFSLPPSSVSTPRLEGLILSMLWASVACLDGEKKTSPPTSYYVAESIWTFPLFIFTWVLPADWPSNGNPSFVKRFPGEPLCSFNKDWSNAVSISSPSSSLGAICLINCWISLTNYSSSRKLVIIDSENLRDFHSGPICFSCDVIRTRTRINPLIC